MIAYEWRNRRTKPRPHGRTRDSELVEKVVQQKPRDAVAHSMLADLYAAGQDE